MTRSKIRLGIAEDHPLYLDMLAECLGSEPDIEICARANSVKAARDLFGSIPLDVAILDVFFPDGNGIGLGINLQRQQPNLAIVMLSNGEPSDWLLEVKDPLRENWMYLSKKSAATVSVLRELVRAAARQIPLSSSSAGGQKLESRDSQNSLTRRQWEILRLLSEGLSNKQIGDQLGINESSVINHLSGIYSSLHIDSHQNPRVVAVLHYLNAFGSV